MSEVETASLNNTSISCLLEVKFVSCLIIGYPCSEETYLGNDYGVRRSEDLGWGKGRGEEKYEMLTVSKIDYED